MTCFEGSINKIQYGTSRLQVQVKLCVMSDTFGMEGNEAVTQRPLLHRFIENNLL